MASPRTSLAFAVVLGCPLASFAQSIFVDTSADVVDFGGAQTVADLPGPDGKISLAEAGLASDHTPGVQTIGFHVPPADWQYQQFFPGRVVLRPFLGFRMFDTAILDGTTQTAFTGETNPNGGAEVVIWAETYLIDSVGGAILGLDGSGLHLSGGSNNVVRSNTNCGIEVFDSNSNVIGGTNPGDGNVGPGVIQIDRANDNIVIGNTASRVRVLGWFAGGQPATNNRIGGKTLAERNHVLGSGTLNSEGIPSGYALQLFDTQGTVIENDWIGMSVDGLAQGHQWTTTGIWFDGENRDVIVRENRVAGVRALAVPSHGPSFYMGTAISITGTGAGVIMTGNQIGLDANDQPTLGSVTGIATANYYLGPLTGLVIGGIGAGEGNEIAGHLGAGITLANSYSGVSIRGNSIHDDGGLGIDLVAASFATGVTPNDPLDADAGANGLQNFPVIASATRQGGVVRIVGSLASSAAESFTLDFYASPQCDPSGFGEGQIYIGATSVTTDAAGNAAIDVTLPAAFADGFASTATATRAQDGSTSEFSACVPITGSGATWTDLGFGLAGLAGVPHLAGFGTLGAGSTLNWSLSGARPFATAWLVAGLGQLHLPFAGGVLVPTPDVVVPFVIDAAGALDVVLFLPSALPPGTTVTVQDWLIDPAAVAGFAASNSIARTAP